MPTLQPYALTFYGGLHIGTRGVNLEEAGTHLPADTLFAAILDVWRWSGGDVATFAAPFVAERPDPPFLLSSGFPFAGGVRFYPMPADPGRLFTVETIRQRGKGIKGIGWLSERLFRRALAGEKLDDLLFPEDARAEPKTGVALQHGALWLTTDETGDLPASLRMDRAEQRHAMQHKNVWGEERVPRVTVHRINSASTIYHSGRVTFNSGCGLWFGVERRGSAGAIGPNGLSWDDAFEQALALLADDGLGGERSSGYGAFTCTKMPAPDALPDPAPGRPAWLLSRYHPRRAELPAALTAPDAAYKLVGVGGWLRTPDAPAQRRKRLMLVREGSLVCPASYPAGDVTDVQPDFPDAPSFAHPVYRYGLALAAGAPPREARNG